VIVDATAVLGVVVTLVGLALMLKSLTVYVTVAVFVVNPELVPVTVTVYVAATVELQLRLEVAVPAAGGVTLLGVRVHVNPAGVTDEDNATA
jgi:hypothetical protein